MLAETLEATLGERVDAQFRGKETKDCSIKRRSQHVRGNLVETSIEELGISERSEIGLKGNIAEALSPEGKRGGIGRKRGSEGGRRRERKRGDGREAGTKKDGTTLFLPHSAQGATDTAGSGMVRMTLRENITPLVSDSSENNRETSQNERETKTNCLKLGSLGLSL